MKTVKFFTLGCKVNQYETQVIREQFLNSGFKEIDNHLPADVYIINTCTVTHRADSESLNFIRRAKRENPKAKIVVSGCLTELDEDKIKNIGGIDLIIKNKEKNRILELLNWQTGKLANWQLGITNFHGHTRAFLKIQDGCNNLCSYCKVPLVRGRSESRHLNEIIQEAEQLVKNGFKEIVLCGICLGSYGHNLNPQISLMEVIEALEDIDGLLRIRLSSIEAGDVTDELIDKMAQSLPAGEAGKKLCRHLHIPIQSGDDEILKKMNRKYCRADYMNLIKKIRNAIPEIAITTDVMVGFPGESETHFQNTAELTKEILPLKVHIFPYSRREGTAAANFSQETGQWIIKQRIKYLKRVCEDCAFEYKKQFLGKNMQVLIEEKIKKNNTFWVGHTGNYLTVAVKSNADLKNQLIALKLKNIDKDCIIGEL